MISLPHVIKHHPSACEREDSWLRLWSRLTSRLCNLGPRFPVSLICPHCKECQRCTLHGSYCSIMSGEQSFGQVNFAQFGCVSPTEDEWPAAESACAICRALQSVRVCAHTAHKQITQEGTRISLSPAQRTSIFSFWAPQVHDKIKDVLVKYTETLFWYPEFPAPNP